MSMTFTDSRFSTQEFTTVKVHDYKHESGHITLIFEFETNGGLQSHNHEVKICLQGPNMSVIVATMIEELINLQDYLPDIPLLEDEDAEVK